MKLLIVNEYIIRHETKMITAEFDLNGNFYSKVIEGSLAFIVKKKPIEIVKESLNYYGFNLEGAISGSKAIIGPCHMAPIRIPGQTDMYWFPHLSPYHDECVWFALHHIENIEEVASNQSKVTTTDGISITLDVQRKRLVTRMDKADQLEIKINKNKHRTMSMVLHKRNQVHLTREGKRNYVVKKED